MKLIIDIPESDYTYINKLERGSTDYGATLHLYDAVRNGTPLPKGHGRIVDVNEIIKIANKTKDLHGAIWNAPAIIEAETESEEINGRL